MSTRQENIDLQSIDLVQYWRIIHKRWAIVVAIPVLALITSGILSFFVLKPVYQATATVIVGKTSAEQSDKQLEYSSIMANQQLAQTYEAIAKSRTVLERVATTLGDPTSGTCVPSAIPR